MCRPPWGGKRFWYCSSILPACRCCGSMESVWVSPIPASCNQWMSSLQLRWSRWGSLKDWCQAAEEGRGQMMECCVAYVLATPVYAGIILPGCLGVRVIGRPLSFTVGPPTACGFPVRRPDKWHCKGRNGCQRYEGATGPELDVVKGHVLLAVCNLNKWGRL